jgi:hypothetical protein
MTTSDNFRSSQKLDAPHLQPHERTAVLQTGFTKHRQQIQAHLTLTQHSTKLTI